MTHWVFSAARAHREYVRKMPGVPYASSAYTDPTMRPHLLEMLDKIEEGGLDGGMTATKACRWLGWIQACLVVQGVMTLDEAKAINKQASEAK